ncbi:hypothetical protein BpHYR1_034123 [Brachionus plicatilis]|uniref:Uncharacterized protein n=1 Tax=Brachionus plicatilis TaxID=10195 RepID=A0A3M7PU61_BRAPC|nr:hypothetical protein BpHYR1_034123 [Brachionus plicatilis]
MLNNHGEANQVLYANSENIDDNSCVEPSTSNPKPSTNPRIPLHQILAQCTNESDSDEEFDYINSLKNNQVLEKMREEKRREKASLESNISKRLVELTQDAFNNEINNYWKSDNLKRKRIAKNDIKFATNRLKKKIRIEETNNMHLAFLERNRDQV